MKNIRKTITIIFICLAAYAPWCIADDKLGPIMVFDSLVFDFGKVKQNDTMSFDFSFTNNGDGPLKITQYQTFCDCTAIENVPEKIDPGEKASIRGTFHSKNYKGEVERMIKLMTNEKVNEAHVLYIKADVTELIRIEPENTMMFQHEAKEGIIIKEMTISSVDGRRFAIKDIKSKVDFLTGMVIVEEEKKKEKAKDEKEKMKSSYKVNAAVDCSKIPDFDYFYIAVELAFLVEFEQADKGTIEQKTMLLIFNEMEPL
ncbi:MAG: DUF1573 domain-containing protein [Spirochaetales bacterium]|nr:DUF1573 domain-containing protein [Spirochaetales bacterium]